MGSVDTQCNLTIFGHPTTKINTQMTQNGNGEKDKKTKTGPTQTEGQHSRYLPPGARRPPTLRIFLTTQGISTQMTPLSAYLQRDPNNCHQAQRQQNRSRQRY
ncbi:Hypothetical predicted protein [Pelobates cultripes]|uniref:Uncharacterized protein n=1 Tax=Pelobates cultripes TaxID=61616 RepID=A0AAD1TDJ8_PELCU|nr:Hypothetical predicted protein [Pelobates cultripes]